MRKVKPNKCRVQSKGSRTRKRSTTRGKGLEVPCHNTFKDKPAFIKRLIKVFVALLLKYIKAWLNEFAINRKITEMCYLVHGDYLESGKLGLCAKSDAPKYNRRTLSASIQLHVTSGHGQLIKKPYESTKVELSAD